MAVASGTYWLRPESGQILVKTGRTGLGSRAGHDLTIEVTRWEGSATIDTADPSRSSVAVTVDVGSLEVREGTGGLKPLTDSDRGTIQRTIREEILNTAQYPTITFRSIWVEGTPESFTLAGELTIKEETRPISVTARTTGDDSVSGTATVVQSQWGIKPYSAFFGALRLADPVVVEFQVTLSPA
jgi:polyisoprenoid-binding protein YceI